MPTVSIKQRNFMKRVATDKKFAQSKDITQKVAREFLKADEIQARCMVCQNVGGWIDKKDYRLWVTGKPGVDIESLAKKLADVRDAKVTDLDALVNKQIKKDASQKDNIDTVFEALGENTKLQVIYGIQVPFFVSKSDDLVLLDLSRVQTKDRDTLQTGKDNQPSLPLYKASKKTPASSIVSLIKSADHNDKTIKSLLGYDPKDLPKVSTESIPPSARW